MNTIFGPPNKENLYIVNTHGTKDARVYETRESIVHSEAALSQFLGGQFITKNSSHVWNKKSNNENE